MKNSYNEIHTKLHKIYEKYRKRHKENPDSKQICCMWSTSNPPDIVEGSSPFLEIEETFGILIDDDNSMDMYDMNIEKASERIVILMKQAC